MLAQIRQRKERSEEQFDDESTSDDEEKEERQGFIKRASNSGPPIAKQPSKNQELMNDLRTFIAFNDGRVTTDEILHKFQSKIQSNFSAIFRSMLKKICEMQKLDGKVYWQLKPEFC